MSPTADYNLGTARGKVEIDASGVGKGLAQANSDLDKFGANSERTSQGLRNTGAVMVGAAAGIAAGFGVAINAAADFESRMSAIKAVSGATEAELGKLSKKALQLGADTKFSASESASAMEELVKAGLSVEDVLNGAADATVNLAAAGEVDLVTAATLAANAMNAFGLSAEEMPKVADLIAGAANASAIDVNEFGQSLSQAGAMANLVGLDFDDLSVAIAAMGNAGIKGSDAGTSLKTFLSNLQPVTTKQTELFKELGLTLEDGSNAFFTAEGSIKSMSEIAGVLGKSLEGMTDAQKTATLEALFGSDAIRAAAIIADTGAEGFDALAESMGKVSAQEVAETRMDNLAGSIEQLKGSVETLLIIIGRPLADALRVWVDRITSLVNWIGALDEDTLALVTTIGKVVAAFLGAGGGVLIVISYIAKLRAAMILLRAAMIAHPIGLFLVVVAALGAALYTLYQNNEQFREAVQKLFGLLKATALPIIDQIMRGFRAMIEVFNGEGLTTSGGIVGFFERVGLAARDVVDWVTGELIPAVQEMVAFFMAEVVPVLQDVADKFIWLGTEVIERLIGGFNWLMENVAPVVVAFGELLFAVGERIAQAVALIVAIIQTLTPVFLAIFGVIQGIITTFVRVAIEMWERFGGRIVDAIMIAFNLVKTLVESALKIIQGIIQVVTAIISGDWGKAWEGIKNILAGVWDGMKGIVTAAIEGVKNIISTALGVIKLAWDAAWSAIKSVLSSAWEAMKSVVSAAIGVLVWYFVEVPQKIIGALGDLAGKLYQFFNAAVKRANDGITVAAVAIYDFFTGLPGKILSWIGNLGSLLLSAGKALVQGFIDGIGSMVGAVKDKLGSITSSLTSWKGPPQYDARILTDNGRLVMQGFMDGIESQLPNLKAMLGDIAPMMTTEVVGYSGGVNAGQAAVVAPAPSVTYSIGEVIIPAKDLEEMRTVQDFFARIEQTARQGVSA